MSSGDNSNIIAARVARETFGVGHVVARIYDPLRAEVYERLGIPTIATVPWTANRLLKNILGGTIDEEWRDPTGQVVLLHVILAESWVGEKISAFEEATGGRVALISRFGKGELPTRTGRHPARRRVARHRDRRAHRHRPVDAASDGPAGGQH